MGQLDVSRRRDGRFWFVAVAMGYALSDRFRSPA